MEPNKTNLGHYLEFVRDTECKSIAQFAYTHKMPFGEALDILEAGRQEYRNGEHSHRELIESKSGGVLWSEEPIPKHAMFAYPDNEDT